MNTVYYYVYRANGLNSKWCDNAIDAIEDLGGQINPYIYTSDEGNIDINLQGNWNDTLDHFESVLKNRENETIADNEYHMLLINSSFSGHGAGRTEGAFGPHGNASDSPGVVGGANVASKYNASCYGSNPVFKPTVIHEFCHAMMHRNEVDTEGNYDEHDQGTVHAGVSGDPVTPMQLWYTADPCSDNKPPEDGNCTNTSQEYSEGTTSTLASCAHDTINEYMGKI